MQDEKWVILRVVSMSWKFGVLPSFPLEMHMCCICVLKARVALQELSMVLIRLLFELQSGSNSSVV